MFTKLYHWKWHSQIRLYIQWFLGVSLSLIGGPLYGIAYANNEFDRNHLGIGGA